MKAAAQPRRSALLFIDSLKIGGAERVTLQWAEWLSEEGWSVTLLTSKSASHDFYPVPAGLRRVQEPALPGLLDRALFWPLKLLRLRKLLQREQPDLLIGMTTLPSIKLALASVGLSSCLVLSERNYPPARPLAWRWRLLRRLAYPRAHLHLVQTQGIAQWLHQRGLARRTAVLPNAIVWPIPRLAPWLNPERSVPPGQKLILAVGTKLHQKGFDRLVAAFAGLQADFPDWSLVILGIDDALYRGVNQAARLRAQMGTESSRLILPGNVGNVGDWYKASALFVLSSRFEGYPNVLLEAMASGLPCLAVDCPTGPSDLIDPGLNGWLVSEQVASTDMEQPLRQALEDKAARVAFASKAQAVRQRNAPESLRPVFLDLMGSL
ncbi:MULTISPECIES: glycosyltransferase [unclassified Synechococcus]|uniref:glycosyltransferase n=1 Tax=unclassified Synechococcus TaxID=2626047 RepID=UPI001CF8F9A3|nr:MULTISPECIES: glycosyltransferase [unclassified Synechococcus]MCB4378433.1 glycosyltransferase family 4 protein [Synechococcus sp. MU1650]MCB4412072.1 glycosyltransferase family 4 protein [Synechococcus sp. MU1611]